MNQWRETLQFSDYDPLFSIWHLRVWVLYTQWSFCGFLCTHPSGVQHLCCCEASCFSCPQLSYSDWWLIWTMSIQPITMTYGHVNIAPLNILANLSQRSPLTTCSTPTRSASPAAPLNLFEKKYRMSGFGSQTEPKCSFPRWILHLPSQVQASVYSILSAGNAHNLNVYQLWIPWEYCAVFVSVGVSFIHYEWRGRLSVFFSWMSAVVLCVLCHIWMTGVYITTSKFFNTP